MYRTIANINVCAEIKLLKVKVPLICLGTQGVSARREGRYLASVECLQALATARIPELDRLVDRRRRKPGRVVGEGP